VTTLALDRVAGQEVASALDDTQVVFVTGGFAFYLLEHVRRTGFDDEVVSRVNAGALAYVGLSAGAALAGPDIGLLRDPDDPGLVDSTCGLGLVPFVVLAHRNRGRAQRHDEVADATPGHPPIISITDSQAVIVEGGQWATCPSL
jgi:dipeptidase E